MSSATKILCALVLVAAAHRPMAATDLHVCADPNNLPYSNDQRQGFENQIADLIAKDLGMNLTYFWFPQRESFFRKTLKTGVCDVIMGVPTGIEEADTTRPYYRSSFVFVSRRDRNLHISSFDDPRLRRLKIGVHVLSEQSDSLPPVYALTSRGITQNLVGYSIFGNLNEQDPPADLLRAVVTRKIDVAVAWGPLAGYFAEHSRVPITLTPVVEDAVESPLRFHFDIAIGVRKGNTEMLNSLNAELLRRHSEITAILQAFGVPQINKTSSRSHIRGD